MADKEMRGEKILRERLIAARAAAGMTQSELAERVGTRQATVSAWERTGTVSAQFVRLICEALNVSIEHLKGEKERLTAAQTAVLTHASAQMAALQEYIAKALRDPAWAESEIVIIRKHAERERRRRQQGEDPTA